MNRNFRDVGPQPNWIFGVCVALAHRCGWPLWVVRLAATGIFLTFNLLSVLAYFVTAMSMDETRPGAQRRLRRWAVVADRILDSIMAGCRRLFSNKRMIR